jgi:hypothetical protein
MVLVVLFQSKSRRLLVSGFFVIRGQREERREKREERREKREERREKREERREKREERSLLLPSD